MTTYDYDSPIAYVGHAAIYCPKHILDILPSEYTRPVALDTNTPRNLIHYPTAEQAIDALAAANGFDRADEQSYDSGECPKPLWAVEPGETCDRGHYIIEPADDTEACLWRVSECDAGGQVIDHGTARTIASLYMAYGACVSTGTLGPDALDDIDALLDDGPGYAGSILLSALREYVGHRLARRDGGQVDGWADLWVYGR